MGQRHDVTGVPACAPPCFGNKGSKFREADAFVDLLHRPLVALLLLLLGDSLAGHGYLQGSDKRLMKAALVAVAALTLAAVPVQAQTGDQAQLVLISGVNGSYHSMGGVYHDVINKVTFNMPTMQGCVEAGKLWAQVEGKETGLRKGWRKFQCFERF